MLLLLQKEELSKEREGNDTLDRKLQRMFKGFSDEASMLLLSCVRKHVHVGNACIKR